MSAPRFGFQPGRARDLRFSRLAGGREFSRRENEEKRDRGSARERAEVQEGERASIYSSLRRDSDDYLDIQWSCGKSCNITAAFIQFLQNWTAD